MHCADVVVDVVQEHTSPVTLNLDYTLCGLWSRAPLLKADYVRIIYGNDCRGVSGWGLDCYTQQDSAALVQRERPIRVR